jgi:PAS domain S-box-containing protein
MKKETREGLEQALDQAQQEIQNLQQKLAIAQRTSAQRFRAIFESAAVGMALVDPEGRPVETNPALQKMLGYSAEELRHKSFGEFTHPDDLTADLELYQELQAGERDVYQMEKRYIRKDGVLLWGRLTVSRVRPTDDTDESLVLGMVEDITERQLAKDYILQQSTTLEAINQVLHETLTSEDVAEVARTGLTMAEEMTGSAFGFIGEINADGRLDTIAMSNPGWDACTMPESDATALINDMEVRGIWSGVIKDSQALIINEPSTHPDRVDLPQGHPPLASFLGVPLKRAGETFGLIALANKEAGYTIEDQQAVESLAIALVEALHRKRAELHLQENRAHLETLYELSQNLNAARDADEVLQALAAPLKPHGVFRVNLSYIDLDPAGKPAWVEAVANWQAMDVGPSPVGMRWRMAEYPFAGLLLSSPDAPQLIADVATDERLDEGARTVLTQLNSGAIAIVPLTQGGRWVGLISYAWTAPYTFTARQTSFFNALVTQAAPVIANLRMMDQLERRVAERTGEMMAFKTLVANSVNAVGMADLEGNLTYANQACYELLGYDYESQDILGVPLMSFWLEEDLPFLKETIIPKAMTTGWRGEVKQKRRDGQVRDVDINVFPIHNAAGEPIQMAAVLRDITAQKRTEVEMQRLVAVLNYSRDYIATADGEGNITYVNPGGARMIGYDDPADAMDRSIVDMHLPEDAQRVAQEGIPMAMEKGEWRGENRLMHRDGHLIPVDQTIFPVYDKQGEILTMATIMIDITDRKRDEEERKRLQQEIIEAQRLALQELSTPIIPVMDRIIVMPLVGSIDTMRARDIMRALLEGISEHRASYVILDVTGVPIMDTGIVNHINKTIQAAQLKGAQTIVTGISDAVAEAVVDLGIDWSAVETLSDLRTGLIVALNRMGIELKIRR